MREQDATEDQRVRWRQTMEMMGEQCKPETEEKGFFFDGCADLHHPAVVQGKWGNYSPAKHHYHNQQMYVYFFCIF